VGIITPALNLTRQVVRQFLRDQGVRELVTYRKWASQEFDQALKHNVDTYNETTNVRAIRLRAADSVKMVEKMGIEAGDVVFMMDYQDAPAGASMKDQIVDARASVFKIKEARPVFGIVWAFVCEGPA
jgi:hypothetical protein